MLTTKIISIEYTQKGMRRESKRVTTKINWIQGEALMEEIRDKIFYKT